MCSLLVYMVIVWLQTDLYITLTLHSKHKHPDHHFYSVNLKYIKIVHIIAQCVYTIIYNLPTERHHVFYYCTINVYIYECERGVFVYSIRQGNI